MTKPTELHVRGLFGRQNHSILLRSESPITILTGPNGSGKTHVLHILECMLSIDLTSYWDLPVEESTLVFGNGTRIEFARVLNASDHEVAVGAFSSNGTLIGQLRETIPKNPIDERNVPNYVNKVGDDTWFDQTSARYYSAKQVAQRFGIPYTLVGYEVLRQKAPWLDRFVSEAPATFISTARLDLGDRGVVLEHRRRTEPAARIMGYISHITEMVDRARRQSLLESQDLDRTFANRALDKARVTVQESELRQRHRAIAAQHALLSENNLTASLPLEFPQGRTNPTERRIINVFLDDWSDKLAPLMPVQDKLTALREIIAPKMVDKNFGFLPDGGLKFSPRNSFEEIPVAALSSGEQHLLALFISMLFVGKPGGVVLIDEPEISLHAAWKHSFIHDLAEVCRLNDVRVVLATHSTAIINGKWELVEELAWTEQ